MVNKDLRSAGSVTDFQEEWQGALAGSDPRFFIFPRENTGRQADFFEWIKVQQITELLEESKINTGRMLEYGCGAAGISLYLASQGYDAHICDLAPNALFVAKKNRQMHAPEVQISSSTVANGLQFPYRNDSFDVVMSFGLLEHFEPEPLSRLLDETIRVLKPGGLFIADIIPGPRRLNVRTLGLVSNYFGSMLAHLLKGNWQVIKTLHGYYFDEYFETAYSDQTWRDILTAHGLKNVKVAVCRPFPPLALSGTAESVYTDLIRRCLRFHRHFDKSDNWFVRRWGWMYLSSGRK